jgi:hypothetical protein
VIQEAAARLIAAAEELDRVSKELVRTEFALEQVESEVEDFSEAFVANLWDEHIEREAKFPPEPVREALAHRAMDKQLYARYRACKRARTRAKQRLTDLREIVAAKRSIVSAAKTEIEATESAPQPAWSGSREFPYG